MPAQEGTLQEMAETPARARGAQQKLTNKAAAATVPPPKAKSGEHGKSKVQKPSPVVAVPVTNKGDRFRKLEAARFTKKGK